MQHLHASDFHTLESMLKKPKALESIICHFEFASLAELRQMQCLKTAKDKGLFFLTFIDAAFDLRRTNDLKQLLNSGYMAEQRDGD